MIIMRKSYMPGVYQSTDKLGFVIANDYRLLQVMSRFGISLGFGEKTDQLQFLIYPNNQVYSVSLYHISFLNIHIANIFLEYFLMREVF